MKAEYPAFGEYIYYVLYKNKTPVSHFARSLEIDRGQLYNYLRGQTKPMLDMFIRIAKGLSEVDSKPWETHAINLMELVNE